MNSARHGGALIADAGIRPSPSLWQEKGGTMKTRTSARIRSHKVISRKVASRALRSAFPGRSEHETCTLAASVLDTSPDTIRRILREETDAKFSLILPILSIALAARGISALELLEGGGE